MEKSPWTSPVPVATRSSNGANHRHSLFSGRPDLHGPIRAFEHTPGGYLKLGDLWPTGRRTREPRLLGVWYRTRTEGLSDEHRTVRLQFSRDGLLLQSTRGLGGWRTVEFSYRVTGQEITLTRASSGEAVRFAFRIESDGTLCLEHGPGRSWYSRASSPVPVP
jgi:hypothetical protein